MMMPLQEAAALTRQHMRCLLLLLILMRLTLLLLLPCLLLQVPSQVLCLLQVVLVLVAGVIAELQVLLLAMQRQMRHRSYPALPVAVL
jgi:uncharacterized membrane protein